MSRSPTPLNRDMIDFWRTGIDAHSRDLEQFFRPVQDFNRNTIQTVIELGPQLGLWTGALLDYFPQALIQTIDWKPHMMIKELTTHSRVDVHKGAFVEVLNSGQIQPADIITFIGTADKHGFNPQNVHLLSDHLTSGGLLISAGECGYVNTRLLRNHFDVVSGNPWDPTPVIWKVKTNI